MPLLWGDDAGGPGPPGRRGPSGGAGSSGDAASINQSLERASRVADFLELGKLMCRDALTREESCGGHFREEYQYPDGECKRDDEKFAHVAAWEYQGDNQAPVRNTEPLNYETVKMSVRSYK